MLELHCCIILKSALFCSTIKIKPSPFEIFGVFKAEEFEMLILKISIEK